MAPKKRKRAPPANAEILREQIQLLKTEKELKTTLEKVNEQINKLLVSNTENSLNERLLIYGFFCFKVEELQLKSALAKSQSTQSSTPKVEPINAVYQFDSVNVINEQKLNLLPGCSQSVEEYDDD